MRFKGTLVEWKDDRGFGFIEPADGGSRIFCHIKAFEVRVRRPVAGDRLTYELEKGKDGRTSAARVRPVGLEEARYQSNIRTKPKQEQPRNTGRSIRLGWRQIILVLILLAGTITSLVLNWQKETPRFSETSYQPPPETQRSPAPRESQDRARSTEPAVVVEPPRNQSSDQLWQLYQQRQSNVQVESGGIVERTLTDDSDGSRHQRFIVRVSAGQTVLIAHNIDLASRIPLAVGDRVEFNGEYEWNDKGGVIHWTHRDPSGRHVAGWIRHKDATYQ